MDNTPKAFLFVGHENWGKSDTLRSLEKRLPPFRRAPRGKIIRIMNRDFFLSRMSNDDRPDEYIKILLSLDPLKQPYVILAFCPHLFEKPRKRTRESLHTLRGNGYALYFWVLETKQGKGIGQHVAKIEQRVIKALAKHGTVGKFRGNALPRIRAEKFQAFVESHI
jgi:hypothetical protein